MCNVSRCCILSLRMLVSRDVNGCYIPCIAWLRDAQTAFRSLILKFCRSPRSKCRLLATGSLQAAVWREEGTDQNPASLAAARFTVTNTIMHVNIWAVTINPMTKGSFIIWIIHVCDPLSECTALDRASCSTASANCPLLRIKGETGGSTWLDLTPEAGPLSPHIIYEQHKFLSFCCPVPKWGHWGQSISVCLHVRVCVCVYFLPTSCHWWLHF